MSDALALFADSVNAVRGGNPEEIAAVNALWDASIPKHVWTWEDHAEGVEPWEVPDVSDDTYDRIADAYERRLGL